MVYTIDPHKDREYVEEFRKTPIGAHSPGLQRILNVMRLDRGGAQPVLVCRRHFADYVIGSLPTDRSRPVEIEASPVFATRDEAEWELFRRRWLEHTGETLDPSPHD